MLKKFKLKITAVIVFASMFMTLIPTLGVFADVQISNADDYFVALPVVENKSYNKAILSSYTYGIGTAYNSGDEYIITVNSAPGSFKLTTNYNQTQNKNFTLGLNFGMFDGEKEVITYYGTNGAYSYAIDMNLNFADTKDFAAGSGVSNIDGSDYDTRSHFILQGFGSGEIYLYQNGWKYDGNKVGNFTDLTDGKLENGSYTAVYTISMGKDLASSKGSWKLLKKDINGNVTQTIPLSQNITLKNSVEKSWGTVYYDNFGIKAGLNSPYTGSSIEITGARFYKESITEDASEALSQLPTLNGVRPDNANSQANMLGKLEFAGGTQCSFNTAPGKITVRAPYGASWVGDAHKNHVNGVWFNFDDVVAAPNAGMYVYEADITTHNLGSLETKQSDGEDVAYSSSVNNPSGNRMRWALVGSTVGINIYKDGFTDNSNEEKRKAKVEDGDIGSANLKLIGVLNIGNDTEKADLAIYYKKDGDPIKFVFSRKVDVSSLTSISGSYLCLNAPIETEDKPVSMDITGAKFYKKELSNSLSFNSVSYTKGDDGITVNAKYDYTRASDMNYTVIAAVYDAETNELVSVNLQNVSVNASDYLEGTKDVSINLDYTGDMTGKNVKLFTWNSIEGMVPMFVSESVNNA